MDSGVRSAAYCGYAHRMSSPALEGALKNRCTRGSRSLPHASYTPIGSIFWLLHVGLHTGSPTFLVLPVHIKFPWTRYSKIQSIQFILVSFRIFQCACFIHSCRPLYKGELHLSVCNLLLGLGVNVTVNPS